MFAPLVVTAVLGLLLLARLTRRALRAPFTSGESSLVGKHGAPRSTFVRGRRRLLGQRVRGRRALAGRHRHRDSEGDAVEVVEVLRSRRAFA